MKLWTRIGKFYTIRYSGRGYEKGIVGWTFGYYDFGKVEEYTVGFRDFLTSKMDQFLAKIDMFFPRFDVGRGLARCA